MRRRNRNRHQPPAINEGGANQPQKQQQQTPPQPRFYKTATFYFSLLALIVSATALSLNYVNSPWSGFVKAKLIYYFADLPQEDPPEMRHMLMIYNEGNATAENVTVSIPVVGKEGQKPVFKVLGYEHSVLQQDANGLMLKFPSIPQKSYTSFFFGNCKPLLIDRPHSTGRSPEYMVTIMHNTGMAEWRDTPTLWYEDGEFRELLTLDKAGMKPGEAHGVVNLSKVEIAPPAKKPETKSGGKPIPAR